MMSLLPARAVEGLEICIIILIEKGFFILIFTFSTPQKLVERHG